MRSCHLWINNWLFFASQKSCLHWSPGELASEQQNAYFVIQDKRKVFILGFCWNVWLSSCSWTEEILPQGTFGNVWRHFWFSQLDWGEGGGGGDELHRSQGCGWTSCNSLPPHPPTKNYLAQNVSSAEVEKPWIKGMASKNNLFSHWCLSNSSQICTILKNKFGVEFREWFLRPQACLTEVGTVSWAPSQQVHEQLDQIMHNLQQDRDHHSAENTLRLLRCQWPCVIITTAPAGHIRFCGAWCLYRWETELFKKKNTALVRHRDLVETHASSRALKLKCH